MEGFEKIRTRWKIWLQIFAAVFFLSFIVFGNPCQKKASAKTTMEKTPIGTDVKLIIPNFIADRIDGSMTVSITSYEFERIDDKSFYLDVNFVFNSLGSMNRDCWKSMVVFYNKQGNVINRAGSQDGYIDSQYRDEKPAELGKTYFYQLYIPTAIASNVAAIVFQDYYHDPGSLPNNPQMGQASYWDLVRVNQPAFIASMYDDNMRARITEYRFGNSETGDGYYLYVTIEFISLGQYGSKWKGRALFYDSYGRMIGGENDGYFESQELLALGRTYTFAIKISESIKNNLDSVSFVESWGTNANPGATSSPSSKPSGGKKTQTLSIKKTNLKKILGKKSFKLSVGGKFYTSLSFKSSNKKIATVSGHGSYAMVKMKKLGSVKITITAPKTAKYKQAKKTVTLKIIPATPKLDISVKNGVMTIRWNKVKGAAWYCCDVNWGSGSSSWTKKWTKRVGPAEKGKTYTITVNAQEKEKNPKFKSGYVRKKVKV